MKTTYPGIDYAGIGSTVNRDAATGIRYGVISQNSIQPEAVDDIYFGPHSRDLAWEQAVGEAKKRIMSCFEEDLYEDKRGQLEKVLRDFIWKDDLKDKVDELMELFDEMVSEPPGGKPNLPDVEHVWAVVEQDFSDRACDHECSPLYEHDGYQIAKCLDNDLFISKSPFFTYAQLCSPCVPGACNLDSPLDVGEIDGKIASDMGITSNKCFCLGHDWFDDDKAPYNVYSVETGKLVQPKE